MASVPMRPNGSDQRLATFGEPPVRILSRVRCIGWMLIMASCMEATESYKPVTSSRLGVICAEALSATRLTVTHQQEGHDEVLS